MRVVRTRSGPSSGPGYDETVRGYSASSRVGASEARRLRRAEEQDDPPMQWERK